MASKRSRILWFGVATLILGGLIYFADPSRFISAVLSADPLPLIPAFLLGFSVFFIFANTWHQLLTRVGLQEGFGFSFRLFMAGNFMNSVTPLGQFGGEPFMAMIIERNTDINFEKALSAVVSADIINATPFITFILGGGLYMLAFRTVNDLIIQALYAGSLIFLIGAPIAYIMLFKTGTIEEIIVATAERISNILGRGEKIVEKLDQKMSNIEEAFEVIGSSPRQLTETAALAHMFFVMQVFCLYLIIIALGSEATLAPLYFVLGVSGLANYSPTPGGSGTYEAAMAGALTFLTGLQFPTAITAAVIFRLTTYWPGILIGYISLLGLENGE